MMSFGEKAVALGTLAMIDLSMLVVGGIVGVAACILSLPMFVGIING